MSGERGYNSTAVFEKVHSNRSAAFWQQLGPPVVDNYYTRSLLGEQVRASVCVWGGGNGQGGGVSACVSLCGSRSVRVRVPVCGSSGEQGVEANPCGLTGLACMTKGAFECPNDMWGYEGGGTPCWEPAAAAGRSAAVVVAGRQQRLGLAGMGA